MRKGSPNWYVIAAGAGAIVLSPWIGEWVPFVALLILVFLARLADTP